MKNVKVKEVTRKGAALVAALIMGLTGAKLATSTASAETYTYGTATLVQQEREAKDMTMEDFAILCNNADKELRGKIEYDHMVQDGQNVVFFTNITLIPQEVRDELVAKGIISDIDFENQTGMESLASAYNLIGIICDYNQEQIRKPGITIDKLIDPSIFCFDEKDAKLVHELFVNWFNAYLDGKCDSEFFDLLFKQLTTLNASEKEGNNIEASTGAAWISMTINGYDFMRMIKDYIQENWSKEDIATYFDVDEYNRGQFVLKKGLDPFDLECLNEKEVIVFRFGQGSVFVYDEANNNLFRVLENFHKHCK